MSDFTVKNDSQNKYFFRYLSLKTSGTEVTSYFNNIISYRVMKIWGLCQYIHTPYNSLGSTMAWERMLYYYCVCDNEFYRKVFQGKQ